MFIKNRMQDAGCRMQGAGRQLRAPVECRINRDFSESGVTNPQSGASLIELIMFIVIVSTALAGITVVLNQVTRSSADPMIRKQAMAVAYSLLEEIELQDYTAAPGMTGSTVTQANRSTAYHVISDYNGFATTGIFQLTDATASAPILTNYNASVTVVPEASAWNGIAAGSAVQINVTVSAPSVGPITATGYRTAY